MTPVERLQAAIEKLEKQRAATDPVRPDSQWVVEYDLTETERHILILDSHNGGYDGSIVAEATSEPRAQLIATLHRTIDAQLEMMRSALGWLAQANNAAIAAGSEVFAGQLGPELAIADAILGGAS